MEKFEPIDVEFIINSDEVKIDAKRVKDEIKGIGDAAEEASSKLGGTSGRGQSSGGGLSNPLKGAGDAAEEAGAKAGKSTRQWNGLGNSISQITRELPAFTYSAQTGFLAISNNLPILADEISRIRAENQELTTNGQQSVPVWKQVISNLFSWTNLLSLGITLLTVFSPKIIEFVSGLFDAKEALDENKKSVEALNKAYESTSFQKAIKDVLELKSTLKLAKEGYIDKEDALKKYNETLGASLGTTNDINTAEQTLINKAPAYIEAMLYKAAATQATADAAKALAENQKRQFETNEEIARQQSEKEKALARGTNSAGASQGQFTNLGANTALYQIASLNQQLDDLESEAEETQEKSANIVDKLNKKAAEIAKSAGIDLYGDSSGAGSKVINQRKQLLEKIAALDQEYARKQLDQDAEEIQALKDKFDKVRKLISEFNADPKNANAQINITALDSIQESAESDLVYKQQTRSLKEELVLQKQAYQEYEEYKTQFGVSKAKEKYKDQLKEFDTYADLLENKISENSDAFSAVATGNANGGQSDRVKLLNKEKTEELRIQEEKYNSLYASLMSYEQNRNKIIEDYQDIRAELIRNGKTSEVEELDKYHQEELDNLDDANLKKTKAYKDLFEQVGRLSVSASKKIIADAKQLIETQEMSAEAKAKILKLIADTEEKINNFKLNEIYKITSAIGELGESLRALGLATGSQGLSSVGSLLSGMASGINDVLTAFDDEATTGDKIGTAIRSVANLINIVSSAAAQRKAAEEEYYRSVIGFQNDYNLSLQEQIRLQSILEENVFIKDYEGRITDALAAVKNANNEYQEALTKLEEGQAKIGKRNAIDWGSVGTGLASGAALGATVGSIVPVIGNVIGAAVGGIVGGIVGLFGGKKKKDKYGSLLSEYPELLQESEDGILSINKALAESLIENDLVNESTKDILNNILEWDKALEEARTQIREVITDLTGSLTDDLRTSLVDAFENGEDAAVKMGETVEKVLENIISNLIFNRIFSDAFTNLEDEMAKSFDIGGDGSWTDDFSRFFSEASGLTDDFNQALKDAQSEASGFGFDIFQPDEDQSEATGLQGAIRRELTEDTASELTGLFRGQYDITKRHFQLSERHFELEQKHYSATLQIMQSSVLIEQNTANTVIQLIYAVSELKNISKNTKPSQTTRDLGK